MNEIIQRAEVNAFNVPTDFPESDGTAEWNSTTLILVELGAGKISGLGYSYAHESCVPLIRENLFPIVRGKNVFSISELWNEMNRAVRNFGRNGIASSAIAAVEIALWDLKAKVLNLPFVKLLGALARKNSPSMAAAVSLPIPKNNCVNNLKIGLAKEFQWSK